MEMSPTPEAALRVGDELRRPVPDSGHLAHMPTHIDVLCGNYQDVVDWNHIGIERDVHYWKHVGALNFYGKGVAHAALKQHDAAVKAQRNFESAAATVPETRYIHVVRCQDILGVAREVLAGEIAYHAGEYDRSFQHLRNAVRLEPRPSTRPTWGCPTR